MNLNKHQSVFDPISDLKSSITIIGCGAIGSVLAEMLTRLGIPEITLYDFDTVEPHNITNQNFRMGDMGRPKTEALAEILQAINPAIKVNIKDKYINQRLKGYIFLAVDNIETRKMIVEENKTNTNIIAMFDFRMALYSAQHYATEWEPEEIHNFFNTMNFTHEEAKANVPVSPCGTTLSVAPTVHTIVSIGVINFIKMVRNKTFEKLILVDLYENSVCSI